MKSKFQKWCEKEEKTGRSAFSGFFYSLLFLVILAVIYLLIRYLDYLTSPL